MSALRATLDGQPLAPDEAQALWTRFSAHMDVHRGDFDGFAASEGFARAKVGMVDGQPTLQLRSAGGAAKPKPKAKKARPRRPPKNASAPTGDAPKSKKKGREKRPPRARRDEGVDIGDAKPKRPRRR